MKGLEQVRKRIEVACEAAQRDPASVRLVAVSKRQPIDSIREAYAAGQREFGENYAQDLVRRAEALADLHDIRWRFIGHLQKNKAKYIARLGASADAVDSLELAQALAKRRRHRDIEIFVQVNVAGESQKHGCAPEDAISLCEEIGSVEGVDLRGMMTVPPAGEDPRAHFRALRELNERAGLPELNMGMSSDLETAIEEGATMVRVGTAIFGPRDA